MSVDQLIEEFDQVADRPGAISQLRALIIEAAVTGKFSTTSASSTRMNEEAADPKQILHGMQALLRMRPKYRWKKTLTDAGSVEVIPQGWCVATLNDTGLYVNGIAFGPSDWGTVGRPIIRIQNLSRLNQDFHFVAGEFDPDNVAGAGDLLVSWSATLDAFIWQGPEGVVNQHIFKVIPNDQAVITEFLYWLIKHEIRELARSQHAHGLAMMHINRGPFLAHTVLIPPIPEQRRLVAMLNELMDVCDQLEDAQSERASRRASASKAIMERLTADGVGPGRLAADVEVFLDEAERLITGPEHVTSFRQTILDLAVKGRLVDQDPEDEPVTETLADADGVRRRVSVSDRRAKAEEQELLCADRRWAVPESWEWRGLADLALFIDYRGKTPRKSSAGIRLITAKNVRSGYIDFSPEEFISVDEYDAWMTRGLPKSGDVLFTTEAPMGYAAVVRLRERFALAQRVIDFRSYGAIDPEFLTLQLRATPFQVILNETATGLTAKGIKGAKLKRLPIVVPPLAEQRRIVAKVNEMMAVCDALMAALKETQAIRDRLLEALVRNAVGAWGAASTERAAG